MISLKKRTTLFALSLLMITTSRCQEGVVLSDLLKEHWKTPADLRIPESVCYDPETDIIYVANIRGNPAEKDGNGFISRLSRSGEIINLKWVNGLNAPKGMGVFRGKLYVSDIDEVVRMDIGSGVIDARYKASGAQFLNDITIDPEGKVYISDSRGGSIYRITGGHIEKWLDHQLLENPNGLFFENGMLLAGTANAVIRIDPDNKQAGMYIENMGGIDGLVPDGKGSYLISDWSGHVHLVKPGGTKILLLDSTPAGINAADIDYIVSDSLLLVPTFSDNRVMSYKLIDGS